MADDFPTASELSARLYRPQRRPERLRAMTAAMREIPRGTGTDQQQQSAREALEVLAARGLIPERWGYDPPWSWMQTIRGQVPSPREVAATLSDPSGLEAAIELSREASARAAAWGPVGTNEAGINLRVDKRAEILRNKWARDLTGIARPPEGTWGIVVALIAARWTASVAYPREFDRLVSRANAAFRVAESTEQMVWVTEACWRLLAGAGVPVPSYLNEFPVRPALIGRSFAEIPSPAAPLVDVLWLGYGATYAPVATWILVPLPSR